MISEFFFTTESNIYNSTKNIKIFLKKRGVLYVNVEILNITREISKNTTHSYLVDDFLERVLTYESSNQR